MTEVTSRGDQSAMTAYARGPSAVGSVESNGAAGAGSPEADDASPVSKLLRRAAATVDRWSHEARGGADGELSMRLGEASHAIYRALLALQDRTVS